MPVFKNQLVLDLIRGVRVFLNLEAGIVRGNAPKSQPHQHPKPPMPEKKKPGVRPENLIWMFGQRRTGSTWLGNMMGDMRDQKLWHEPYVGELFGIAYDRAWKKQHERKQYILANAHRKTWLKSIRTFVLDGAEARFPEAGEKDYLVIKDPHGSIGAPLLMEALPESRMIFLIRDPRDIVASCIDTDRKGSWASELRQDGNEGLVEISDDYVRGQAQMTSLVLERTRQAYEAHAGHKVLIRYEDLRHNTLESMQHIYTSLKIPFNAEELSGVVRKHSWENIPKNQKGTGKPRRKAKPGGWREDLTGEQAEMVEHITAPILKEFYRS